MAYLSWTQENIHLNNICNVRPGWSRMVMELKRLVARIAV